MTLDNDTRGWIMAGISGLACIGGASIICVDTILRLLPGMHHFSISESDTFLSASLSLSFGVMLYSALYSMLPQSKKYLEDAGYSPRGASYLQIALFLGGVAGIRVLSGILHKFIPSHVVDCDHSHDEEEAKSLHEERANGSLEGEYTGGMTDAQFSEPESIDSTEQTPLLSRTSSIPSRPVRSHTMPGGSASTISQANTFVTAPTSRKPSIFPRILSRTITRYVTNQKDACDEGGPCMGYSDPCGQECFKGVQRRGTSATVHASFQKSSTWQRRPSDHNSAVHIPDFEPSQTEARDLPSPQDGDHSHSTSDEPPLVTGHRSRSVTRHYHHPDGKHHEDGHHHASARRASLQSHHHSVETDHHHHVPTNAFMSIGLQTSLAIALHKAPEGFITYATNHANPTLGFSVFMALFIHNITEGFAMSLPLYLALNSRWKAIAWSSFLGGVSQPLGAGVAALWFKVAAHGGSMAPNEAVYGCMFAVTSGVMTSVALSLFSESLQLSHNKSVCIMFAFLGMGILGISYALTAS